MDKKNERLVEAIANGRIVKVPEIYAKREGFPILRKPKMTQLQETNIQLPPSRFHKIKEEIKRPLVDYLRNPRGWKETQVTSELVDNFHWQIRIERKRRGITRKQFAKLLNEPEENLKMIEASFLPSADFVLINKIQDALGINLRKDQKDFSKSVQDLMLNSIEMPSVKEELDEEFSDQELSGTNIEVLDDET